MPPARYPPNAVYPVRYSRGRPAHLDVSGERGDAIIRALHDQLGVLATEVNESGGDNTLGQETTKFHRTVHDAVKRRHFAQIHG